MMKNLKKWLAIGLAATMTLAMAACGSSGDSSDDSAASGSAASGETSDEEIEYSVMGNFVYQNEDGGNTDEDGVEWYLYIDAETKFHLVGIKSYENAAPSVRIDEGQVVGVSGYTLECAFTPYSMFTQYLHHGAVDEAVTETVVSTSQEAISAYQDKTGDEFFTLELNRTSNDVLNSGTFTIASEGISLGWGAWQ